MKITVLEYTLHNKSWIQTGLSLYSHLLSFSKLFSSLLSCVIQIKREIKVCIKSQEDNSYCIEA